MNSLPNSVGPAAAIPSLSGRLEETAAAIGGAATVGTLAVFRNLAGWIIKSDAWIFFFLVSKPLIDLTWRWDFFKFSEQKVNIQSFVGLIVLAFNAIAMLSPKRRGRLPKAVLLLLGFATLSVIVSPSSWGINELLRLFAGTAFFYTAGRLLSNPLQFDRFVRAFLTVATGPIILSYLQIFGFLPYDYWDWFESGPVGRVSGTYNTPLVLVYLFIYTIPLSLYIANNRKQTPAIRKFAWLQLIASAIALVFTYHRVGYVAIILEVLIWLYFSGRKKTAVISVVGLAVCGTLLSPFLSILYEPVKQSVEDGSDFSGEHFLRGRGFQWLLYAESYVSGGPIYWLLGRGGSVIEGLDSDDESYILSPNEPHNDYIRILHAYGLVGLVLYLSLIAKFLRRAIQCLNSEDSFARALAQIVLPVLVAVLLLSLTTEPMRYPSAIWYLFALCSALFSVCVAPQRSVQKESVSQ